MKNILPLLLLPLFLSSIFSQVKVDDLHYRGGLYYKINSQVPYTGEESQSEWNQKHKRNEYYKIVIKNGVMVTLKSYYYKNHKQSTPLLTEYRYSNNVIKQRIVYDPDGSGQISEEKNYNRDGLLHGQSTSYYVSNGQIKEKGTYNNGVLDGPYVRYRLDGTIIESIEHSQEPGKSIEHSQEPLHLDELIIKDGLFYSKDNNQQPYSGKLFRNFPSGNIRSEGTMKNGELHGITLEYWENGQVRFETTHRNGKRNGPEKWYYENGNLFLESTYKDDKENGLFKTYHENGQLKGEVTFKDGKETGVFNQYNENGKLINSTTY